MSVLELKDLSYYYSKDRLILNKITGSFERGHVYTIFGPSGCGKSTLLSLLGGLDIPKEGAILFNGEDIAKNGLENHRRNHVSFVFQNYNLIDYMTPVENVQLTSAEDPLSVLQRLGLTADECKRNVLKLSGGQQQRVAIARALASENPIILADEPTGNLDEDTEVQIINILLEAAREYNKCVIIVSHSNEVARQSDIVFELKQGTLNQMQV